MLWLQADEPAQLLGTAQMGLYLFRKPHIVAGVRIPRALEFSLLRENLQPILTDRLQHGEAQVALFLFTWITLLEQALVEDGCRILEEVSRLIAQCLVHRFDGRKFAATHTDREPTEEALFSG